MLKSVLPALALVAAAGAAHAADAVPSRFVFEEICTLAPLEPMGDTPLGHRQRIPITGGTFAGPELKGVVRPGGADTQLKRVDGSFIVDADYLIETDDHVIIHVHNVGAVPPMKPGQPFVAWTSPTFEVPMGRYGWLNSGLYASRITTAGDAQHPAVRITIYRIGSGA